MIKKIFPAISVVFVFCLSGLTLAQYIYDPLQLFHRSFFHDKIYLSGNMRESARAVIDYYDFDSVILGSSMLENTSSKDADKYIGGKFANISVSGGNYAERALILNYLLRKKDIKTVVYSLDYCYENTAVKFPMKSLYNINPIDDLLVYYRLPYLKCLSKFSKDGKCIGYDKEIDRPGAWMGNIAHNARFGGAENWKKHINGQNIDNIIVKIKDAAAKVENGETVSRDVSEQKVRDALNYLKKNVIDIAEDNPDVRFMLLFPPYHRANYAIWAQYELSYYDVYRAVIQKLAEASETNKNIEVYGFDSEADIVDDIGRFKDLLHYHYSVNEEMLNIIARGGARITADNVENYIKENENKAMDFDLSAFSREIGSCCGRE